MYEVLDVDRECQTTLNLCLPIFKISMRRVSFTQQLVSTRSCDLVFVVFDFKDASYRMQSI